MRAFGVLVVLVANWVASGVEAQQRLGGVAVQPPPSVVLLRMAPNFPQLAWPEAEQRVAAELSVAGLQVISVPAEQAFEAKQGHRLDRVAQRLGAQGAMVVVRRRATGDVRVWIRDRASDRTLERRVEANDLVGQDAAAVIALRVVEVVRAGMFRLPQKRDPAPLAKLDEPEIIVEDEPSSLRIMLGATLGWSPGLWPFVGAILQGSWHAPSMPVAIALELSASPLIGGVSDDLGNRASIGLGLARGHALYEPWQQAVVSPAFGLGGGMLLVWARGDAAAGYSDDDDVTAVGILSARVELAVRLREALFLVGGITLGYAVPEVSIRFFGDPIASLGRPLLDSFLGLQWAL